MARTTEVMRLSRTAVGCAARYSCVDLVAHTSERLDQRSTVPFVYLVSTVMHKGVDNVRESIDVISPHVIGDLRTGQHLTWMAHEVLEESKLFRGQFDDTVAPSHFVTHQIQRQILGAQLGGRLQRSLSASQQG